ncbi:hypothetical protein [Roseburia sp. 831b]|uniref:hypothetical protein n=1 Tax=Roseburia sp. 831b TaxID=1261635 RepID=UPI000AFD5833|nr:hypothetical protein [Roseburia sp. 831b]MDY5881798.1 hypothetical protein [Roseburia sp.]WVK73320.1 hypothetical protein BIV16_02040 [Roseburia sp. 831b]
MADGKCCISKAKKKYRVPDTAHDCPILRIGVVHDQPVSESEKMKQFVWNVNWTEKRKHITFQNQNGKKVRDSNLSKTFHLDISKEGLENEFNGNYERVRAEAERTNGSDEELAGYYRQVEAACEGETKRARKTIAVNEVSGRTE